MEHALPVYEMVALHMKWFRLLCNWLLCYGNKFLSTMITGSMIMTLCVMQFENILHYRSLLIFKSVPAYFILKLVISVQCQVLTVESRNDNMLHCLWNRILFQLLSSKLASIGHHGARDCNTKRRRERRLEKIVEDSLEQRPFNEALDADKVVWDDVPS